MNRTRMIIIGTFLLCLLLSGNAFADSSPDWKTEYDEVSALILDIPKLKSLSDSDIDAAKKRLDALQGALPHLAVGRTEKKQRLEALEVCAEILQAETEARKGVSPPRKRH